MRFTNKIVVCGKLKALTPLHIGSAQSNYTTDMPVAVNGLNEPYIPGTSIAGVLKNYIRKHINDTGLIETFFGTQKGNSKNIKSYIIINDAVLIGETNKLIYELRDHNVINRITHSTFDKGKFDTQVISAGNLFDFSFEVDVPKKYLKTFKEIVYLLVSGITEGKCLFGGQTSRGLGRMKLVDVKVSDYDFKMNRKSALQDYLNQKSNDVDYNSWNSKSITINNYNYAEISIKCKLDSPFIIQSGATNIINSNSDIEKEADIIPLYSQNVDGKIVPVLPGSSLKGVFRTRAQMITNTLNNFTDVSAKINEILKKNKKIRMKDIDEMINKNNYLLGLFGSSINLKENVVEEVKKVNSDFKSKIFFEDSYLYTNNNEKIPTNTSAHIKIDRWTGGAIEGALYDIEKIWSEKEDIFLDINLMIEEPKLYHLGLIAHCLKDLLSGDLKVGFGTRRGFGKIKYVSLNNCEINCSDLHIIDKTVFFEGKKFSDDAVKFLTIISDAFNNWIKGV